MADENETKISAAAGPSVAESPVENPVDVPALSGCSVYVITCQGRTKIGIAANVEKRRLGLERSAGVPMLLFSSRRFADREIARIVERELHRRFAQSRGVGEWFSIQASDAAAELATIEAPDRHRPTFDRRTIEASVEDAETELALRHLEASKKGILLPEIVARWKREGIYESNMRKFRADG